MTIGKFTGKNIVGRIFSGSASGSSSGPVKALATGGTETTSGGYKIHTFTSSGTLSFSAGANTRIEYLIIGGGGGGSGSGDTNHHGGSGGAGGFLESYEGQVVGSDFSGPPIFVSSGDTLTITVDGAGTASPNQLTKGADGGNSAISTASTYNVTARGGGGGGGNGNGNTTRPGSGGSAGGCYYPFIDGPKGMAVTSPRQGYGNQTGSSNCQGGGGAGGTSDSNVPGSAAAGRTSSISGSTVTYSSGSVNGSSAAASNTGNGGGGGSNGSLGVNGGSGIVIVRYLL
jgi:hypothetical protein